MSMIPRPARARCRKAARRVTSTATRVARQVVAWSRRYAAPIVVGLLLAVLIGMARTAVLGAGLVLGVLYFGLRGLVRLLDRVEAYAPRIGYAGVSA